MTDKNEIAIVHADPFIEMVERLATNEAVDPDKLQKLVDVQMQVMARNAETEFNAAMSRVQAALPTVLNDAYNSQTSSKYAKLETIYNTIKPIYTGEGFSATFTQAKPETEGYVRVEGTLRHGAGHSVNGYFVELPMDDSGIKGSVNKTKVHATGSSLTYARRYGACMMFDVSTGDDADGNGPQDPPPAKLISEKQAGQVYDMLSATESDIEAFLKAAKIDSVEGMPAHKFAAAMKRLKEKQAGMESA